MLVDAEQFIVYLWGWGIYILLRFTSLITPYRTNNIFALIGNLILIFTPTFLGSGYSIFYGIVFIYLLLYISLYKRGNET